MDLTEKLCMISMQKDKPSLLGKKTVHLYFYIGIPMFGKVEVLQQHGVQHLTRQFEKDK